MNTTKFYFGLENDHILLISESGTTWEVRNLMKYVMPSIFAGKLFLSAPTYQQDQGGFQLIHMAELYKNCSYVKLSCMLATIKRK